MKGSFVRISPWEISVCHPETVKKLYLQPLRKGTFYEFATYPDWRFQNPMSEPDPKRKVERSKTFASGFAQSSLLRSEDVISGTISQLLDYMDTYAQRKEPMDLDKFFAYTAFDVVGEMLCSKPFGFLKEGTDVNNAIATNYYFQELVTWASHLRELHYIAVNPIMTWLSLTPASWLGETAFAAVKDRMARPVNNFDMLSHWLKYVEENPDKATARDIMAQATNVTAAGSDTTASLLQSVIYYLIRNPRTLETAREEVTQIGNSDRVLPFSSVRDLPYLNACIKEALRIHTPIPMPLPRLAPKGGIEIDGRVFPEGITLSGSPWVLHHSRALWGDDVAEFKPERWLGDNGIRLEKYFMPFGAGFMTCPGQNLARIEVLKITSTIIRDYDLQLAYPEKEWQCKMLFAQVPHSWPVYVTKRNRA
jgi:cytochrome P450